MEDYNVIINLRRDSYYLSFFNLIASCELVKKHCHVNNLFSQFSKDIKQGTFQIKP